jgi:transcriptional regulator with XRE-family HTH domain
MTTTIHSTIKERPLALLVTARREWFGDYGITQTELAKLTGVSLATIRRLESTRALPASIEGLLALAIAFGCQIESLVDPREMERIRKRIAGDSTPRERSSIGFACQDDG